jgi:aspartyl-tRNA(Asn)/glutamyl-tRNA(Gln) amidotransferase subunit B
MLANPTRTPTEEIARVLQLTAFSSNSSPPLPPPPSPGRSPDRSATPTASTCTLSSADPTPQPEAILHGLCLDAMAALPDEVEAMRKGHKNVLNKIIGQVIRESRGRADARSVRRLLEELIAGPTEKRK